MIKLLLISIKGFRERKFNNLLIIIQVFISIIIINLLIGTIQQFTYILNVTDNSKLINSLYFAELPRIISARNDSNILADNRISQIKEVNAVGKSLYAYGIVPKIKDTVNIYIYSDILINSLNIPLIEGHWFKSEGKSDVIPIIISKEINKIYKMGEIISISLIDQNTKLDNIKFKIIGIFDNSNSMLRLGACGDLLGLNAVFEKNKYFVILPEFNNIKDFKPFDDYGRILFLNNYSETIQKSIFNGLKDIGYINKMADMRDNYKNDISDQLLQQFVLCLIVFILTLTGIGGNNILMQIFKEREYAIYFMCGMEWQKCVLITCLNNMLTLLIPASIAYFIIAKSNWSLLDQIIISNNNIIASILLIFTIFIITSIQPLYTLYKTEPILIIRRWS